jgi:hypothetical protein
MSVSEKQEKKEAKKEEKAKKPPKCKELEIKDL